MMRPCFLSLPFGERRLTPQMDRSPVSRRPPGASAFERNQRLGPIDVDHCVELVGQPAFEVMAQALAFRQINHADGALQERSMESLRHLAVMQREEEGRNARLVKQCFVASFQWQPDALALRGCIPTCRGGDFARMS